MGITLGCGGNNYCPLNPVTRGQMAIFLTRAFQLGWSYLTVDHLGTPILATNRSARALWQGGFEPFGVDWSGAEGKGIFLRFPGQWVDGSWEGGELSYNLHRWYETGTGRYTGVDPMGLVASPNVFTYVDARPLVLADPTGLQGEFIHPQTLSDAVERGCAQGAFGRNFLAMRRAKWKYSDTYFHCKANCEAAQCGPAGVETACILAELKGAVRSPL